MALLGWKTQTEIWEENKIGKKPYLGNDLESGSNPIFNIIKWLCIIGVWIWYISTDKVTFVDVVVGLGLYSFLGYIIFAVVEAYIVNFLNDIKS